MLFQTPENTNTAMQVFSSLAPAFAAGFAVQRLLEVIDSLFDLNKKIGVEWKQAALQITSLIAGFFLAYSLKIKILTVLTAQLMLGQTIAAGLDYLVSGLIISAGTEGLNSILKFLNYSKEVKKAEVTTEQQTGIPTRILERLPAFPAFTSFTSNGFQKTGDLSADIETSLHNEIKATYADMFNEDKWKETPFKDYTTQAGDAKEIVLDAAVAVAGAYSRVIKNQARQGLQAQVTLDTTPEDIFPKMRNAILFGSM